MHIPFRYNAEVNKNPNAVSYLPEHVMKQNMGLEQQQEEDLMSQDLCVYVYVSNMTHQVDLAQYLPIME